jgi:hypothetical protein
MKAAFEIIINLVWLNINPFWSKPYILPYIGRHISVTMTTKNAKVTDPVSAEHNLSYLSHIL